MIAPVSRTLPKAAVLALAGLAALPAGTARADGEFFQLDFADEARDSVVSVTRGRLSAGATYSEYEGGSAASGAVTWSFPLAGIATAKIGPSFGKTFGDSGDDDLKLGGKIILERWSPAPFGHVFLLGEYSTIDNNYFTLLQTGFGQTGLAAEITAGGSDKYDSVTAGLTKRLGDSPVYLRAGYKFTDETAYIGFAINTF
ncbi:hypothetical protein [Poseidonocella sp. HB161398]|uniref:hypothetical protein n=1 Tax=Poseidonocella sp. HB161398 TaxID=2320855 RepID=UPI001107BA95|nr:hypothetical protein [Poseidonocella sp. HB161398]